MTQADIQPSELHAARPQGSHSRLCFLIPAHNEEAGIAATLRSVLAQSRVPDRIIVVSDNSTDRTVEIASSFEGVEVVETVDNQHRKSGALNYAWHMVTLDDVDYIASMDGDTYLDRDFIKHAVESLDADPTLGGVCACPTPRSDAADTRWKRIILRTQRAEYSRFVGILQHRNWKVHVLSGAGTVYRATALREVSDFCRPGAPWANDSLTEDFLLTLDLRERGWECKMNLRMQAYTDCPVTLRDLWRQRMRWAGGTIGDLRTYGWRPFTRRSILAHLVAVISILIRLLFVTAVLLVVFGPFPIHLHWIWLLPPLLTASERAFSLKDLQGRTWKDTLQAALVIPEELYAVFRETYLVVAGLKVLKGRLNDW